MHHIDNINFSIEDPQLKSQWISDIVRSLEPFSGAVVSWNTNTCEGSSIEIWIRVLTSSGWSMWLSYGKWSNNGKNLGSFSNQKDSIAKLNIDEVSLLTGLGEAFQIKAELSRKAIDIPSPILRSVHITLAKNKKDSAPVTFEGEKMLEVPRRAQLPYEDIGRIICSPTSLAMVLEYYGINLPTLRVAEGSRDNGTSI